MTKREYLNRPQWKWWLWRLKWRIKGYYGFRYSATFDNPIHFYGIVARHLFKGEWHLLELIEN